MKSPQSYMAMTNSGNQVLFSWAIEGSFQVPDTSAQPLPVGEPEHVQLVHLAQLITEGGPQPEA